MGYSPSRCWTFDAITRVRNSPFRFTERYDFMTLEDWRTLYLGIDDRRSALRPIINCSSERNAYLASIASPLVYRAMALNPLL